MKGLAVTINQDEYTEREVNYRWCWPGAIENNECMKYNSSIVYLPIWTTIYAALTSNISHTTFNAVNFMFQYKCHVFEYANTRRGYRTNTELLEIFVSVLLDDLIVKTIGFLQFTRDIQPFYYHSLLISNLLLAIMHFIILKLITKLSLIKIQGAEVLSNFDRYSKIRWYTKKLLKIYIL